MTSTLDYKSIKSIIHLLPDHISHPVIVGRVNEGLRACTKKERQAVELRHGLKGDEPLPFSQIAEKLKVSPQTVHENYRRGIRKMKVALDK